MKSKKGRTSKRGPKEQPSSQFPNLGGEPRKNPLLLVEEEEEKE